MDNNSLSENSINIHKGLYDNSSENQFIINKSI